MKKKQYKVTLSVNNKKFSFHGDTVEKALEKFRKIQFKTHGILTIEKGGLKAEKIMPIRILNRFFGKYTTNVTKQVFVKNLKFILGE